MEKDPQSSLNYDPSAELAQGLNRQCRDFLDKVQQSSKIVSKILSEHPQFDPADLYRIVMKRYDTPDQKLSVGLRRRRRFGDAIINR